MRDALNVTARRAFSAARLASFAATAALLTASAALLAPQTLLAQSGAKAAAGAIREAGDPSTENAEAQDDTPVLNRLAKVGAAVLDPVAEAKKEIGQTCLKVDYPKDFVRWEDVNGDAIKDAFINFDVVCDGFKGVFCGSSSCPGRVFVSDGKGVFRKTTLPLSAKPRDPYKGLPAVFVTLYGADCGGYRAGACQGTRVWDGTDFIAPELLTEAGRQRAAESLAASKDREEALARAREKAQAERDHRVTGALFEAKTPSDPEWEAALKELIANGELQADPAFDSRSPGDNWSYEPMGPGRARAWMEAEYGYASLQFACRAGDETIGIAFSGETGVFAPGAGSDGMEVQADVMVSGHVRGTVSMRYLAARDIWVARISPDGAIVHWMRRGTRASIWEAGAHRRYGDPAGRFTLHASRRAIESMLRACGRTPSDEPPEENPLTGVEYFDQSGSEAYGSDGGVYSRYEHDPNSNWERGYDRRGYYNYDDRYRGGRSRTRIELPGQNRRYWE